MTRFTDSPHERMMTRRPEGHPGRETSRPPSLPKKGNTATPAMGSPGIMEAPLRRYLSS